MIEQSSSCSFYWHIQVKADPWVTKSVVATDLRGYDIQVASM